MSADYARDLFDYAKGVQPMIPLQAPACEQKTTGLAAPARRTDPLSSKIAGDEIEKNGTRRHQIEAVVAIVRLHPVHTSAELSQLTGLDRYLIARRLPEAEALGLVVRSDKLKRCFVSGKLALTWTAQKGEG